MQVQPAEHMSTKLEGASLRTPAVSRRPPPPSSGSDRNESDLIPFADAPALADHNVAYALLTQQCRSKVNALAPRQRDVLVGLVAGCSNKQIARKLGISPRTIEIYRADMMARLKARTLAEALHIAFVAGLMPSHTTSLGNG